MAPDEAQSIIETLSTLPIQEIDVAMVNGAINTYRK